MTFAFSSAFPVLIFPTDFFKNCSHYPFCFENFISLLQKYGWDWEGAGNYVDSSKNLYNNILLLLCVLVEAFLWPNKTEDR